MFYGWEGKTEVFHVVKFMKKKKKAAESVFHCRSSISFVFKVCLLSAAAVSRPAKGAVCHSSGDSGPGSCSSSAEAAAPPEEANRSGQVWL